MKSLVLTGNVVALVCADGQGAPDWVQIVPAGEVRSTKGGFVVDASAMALVLAAFQGRGRDLVIDYEHQTLSGEQAPAAGWIKEFQARADGLWARVEWTELAARYIAAREYRYLSPVVLVRAGDRRVVDIHSVALTNDPAIQGLRPIANRAVSPAAEEDGGMRERLVEILGLKAEATEDEVVAAVGVLKDFRAGVVEGLALNATATLADARAEVLKLKNPGATVPMSEFLALKKRLDDRDAEDLVATALKDGKLAPAHRAWAIEQAKRDPAAFRLFLKDAPVVVPQGQAAGGGSARSGEGGLTENDLLVCRQLGIKPEEYKAQKEGV